MDSEICETLSNDEGKLRCVALDCLGLDVAVVILVRLSRRVSDEVQVGDNGWLAEDKNERAEILWLSGCLFDPGQRVALGS